MFLKSYRFLGHVPVMTFRNKSSCVKKNVPYSFLNGEQTTFGNNILFEGMKHSFGTMMKPERII